MFFDNSGQRSQHFLINAKFTEAVVFEKGKIIIILAHKELVLILKDVAHNPRFEEKSKDFEEIVVIGSQQHFKGAGDEDKVY